LLDLRDISLRTVQACVLLGAFSIVEGEAAAEAVYYSISCRIAMLLDLANAPAVTRLEQEVNRRGMLLMSECRLEDEHSFVTTNLVQFGGLFA
jgi:hypothetical protein